MEGPARWGYSSPTIDNWQSSLALGGKCPFQHEKIGGNLLEIIFTHKNNLLGSASIQAVTKAYLDNAIDEDTFSTYIFMGYS